MTNPIQVVKVEGIGDSLQKAVAPLIEAYQRRQQLELEQERLKLDQQKLKLAEQQRLEEQAQLAQQGQAALQMVAAADAQQTVMPDLPNVQSPIGLGSAFMGQLEANRPVTAFGPVAMALRTTPAVAVPGALEITRDIRQQIVKRQEQQRAQVALQSVYKNIQDTDLARELRDYVTLEQNGTNIPGGAAPSIFPKLFAQPTVDPAIMRSALGFLAAGGLSWGQVRRQHGIAQMAGGIPDDFVVPLTEPGGGKPTQQEAKALFHYRAMAIGAPTIDRMVYGDKDAQGNFTGVWTDNEGNQHQATGGINFTNNMKIALDEAAASGNSLVSIFGRGASWILSGRLSDEQRALGAASTEYIASLKYSMTGAQSNTKEDRAIWSAAIELSNDDNFTKSQKYAYRQAMLEAARELAGGAISQQEAIQRVINHVQNSAGLPDKQNVIQGLRLWQQEQRKHGANATTSTRLTDDPANTMTNDELGELIKQIPGAVQRSVQRVQLTTPP